MSHFSFRGLASAYAKRKAAIRRLHEYAGAVLSASKRAIFAMQRDDLAEARRELALAKKQDDAACALCRKDKALADEGVWRAAQEEYCEAQFFYAYRTSGAFEAAKLPTLDPEILVGGLSDAVGELARCAVLKATEGDVKEIGRMYLVASDAIKWMLRMELTGGLRTKFDQAKQHLRKLEDIRYDLSRRLPL